MKEDIQADLAAVKKRLAELKEQVEEPQTVGEWVFVGLGVGAILGLIVNTFLFWGGSPRGLYWRIDDVKKEIVVHEERLSSLENYTNLHIPSLEERMDKEESKRWYSVK